ncbi:PTS sugar transporter subunit IIA [Wenzhouxiangella sp. AB-CW3]|uniref:PTS sugar transporter subunit IIA n=1 Tax=Wenzhouxiangella sp. AB-CW3 TaxID=2771012 RepID=UPI00168A65D3|nr:PTS sugar transporter subunit IIA [Wenzhouxiangella sp. AB-CW3]QOC21885.1 PTS sugar transporter subunit IIA [Wenzhouxiangella sp. AB-CW3]
MQLCDVIDVDRIAVDISVASKKSLLEKAAALLAAAPESADARDIFDSLCQRERLGSTGLGHGVAIPHGRVAGQQTVAGAVIRLQTPIDFDAPDAETVDLFFALAVPDRCTDVHLRLLADIAERLGSEAQRRAIRDAPDPDQLLRLLATDPTDPASR